MAMYGHKVKRQKNVARKGDNDQIVRSSGSVYRDLGIELTAEDEIKIDAREITRVIDAREYTQQQVARIWVPIKPRYPRSLVVG